MITEFDSFNNSPVCSSEFKQIVGNNYLSCSLIERTNIDIHIEVTQDLKVLQGFYSYDCLAQEIKTNFESSEQLFSFIKENSQSSISVAKDGLILSINQSGIRKECNLRLSERDMTETEKKSIVARLMEENMKLKVQLDKQNIEVNSLLDTIWKSNEKKDSSQQSFKDKFNEEFEQHYEQIKIQKRKIIKKDHSEEYPHHRPVEMIQKRVTKKCADCLCTYQGKQYYRFCYDCFKRSKQILRQY